MKICKKIIIKKYLTKKILFHGLKIKKITKPFFAALTFNYRKETYRITKIEYLSQGNYRCQY